MNHLHAGSFRPRTVLFLLLTIMFPVASYLPDAANGQEQTNSEQTNSEQQTQELKNTQDESIPFTPAQDALDMFELPEGCKVTLFAGEPDVHQPIAATWDARGRLWVVECYTYSDRQTNYDLEQNDRVVIFEDTNGDGRHDQRTVFWDEGKKLTGIELGFGGVWLTAAPDLIFIADENFDDVPDGPPRTLLTGFEGDVIRHNIVNGLRWGPDGWLYGRHGIQATSFVGKPGSSVRTPMNCCVWRFHPVEEKFEIVAQGGTNPWGFDFDKHGEMFISNTVIGHLFHIVPGARYRRMYGSHFNPHLYDVIEQTADHFHWDTGEEKWPDAKTGKLSSGTDAAGGGHAHCGLLIYQGDNWPDEYRDGLMMANFHGRRINIDHIHREGNGYVAHHGPDILKTQDPWFRGVELLSGPDGAVYVLDWSDIGECHENDGIHRTSGRVFKFKFETDAEPITTINLREKSDQELFDLLSHTDQWYVRKARRLLQERAVVKTLGPVENRDAEISLPELWAGYSCSPHNASAMFAEDSLLSLTRHADEHTRAWAVRLLADGLEEISDKTIERFLEMAREDDSGLVRLYLASALSRLESDERLQLASILVARESDADDRTQPKLIWYQIEPAIISNRDAAIKLAKSTAMPLIRENVVRRLTCEIESDPESFELITAWLETETDQAKINHAVAGIAKALEGWSSANPPAGWPVLSGRLEGSENEQRNAHVQQINLVFGDGRTVEQLKKLIGDNSATVETRRRAIESWAATKPDDLFETLQPHASNKSLTNAIVRALVYSDNNEVAKVIFNRFPHMDPEGQSAAITTLTARSGWAKRLLAKVEEGRIPKDRITAWHAGQIYNLGDDELNERLQSVWGRVRDTPEEKLETINRLASQMFGTNGLVENESLANADISNGRLLFKKNCATCHTLFGTGGTTGPDLTGADRFNLNYLLVNIVDPSSSVADNYRASVILMEDGRTISGLVLETTEKVIRVQTPTEIISLDRELIEDMRRTELSVMPEGILENLFDEEVNDLFKYLFSKNQVPLPEDNQMPKDNE